MIRRFNRWGAWLLAAALPWAAPGLAQPAPQATTLTTMYSFTGGADGDYPYSPLVIYQKDQSLWGTTFFGGSDFGNYGCGTIFRMAVPVQTIYTFPPDTNAPMCHPVYLTVSATGQVYGITYNGAVFQVVPTDTGWDVNELYIFQPGEEPLGLLPVTNNGTLIGIVHGQSGGPGGCGYVFRLRPIPNPPWTKTVLYEFNHDTDGCHPQGNLTAYGGLLYGVTNMGGAGPGTYTYGTLFRLSLSDGVLTVLHVFNASEGWPIDGVNFGPGNTLYGITENGGTYGRGIVYSMNPADLDSFKVVDNLSFGDGGVGRPLVTQKGVVYGVTAKSETINTPQDYATVFALYPPRAGKPWTEVPLGALSNGDCPVARLTAGGLALYGVTYNDPYTCRGGGTGGNSWGSIFEVTKQ